MELLRQCHLPRFLLALLGFEIAEFIWHSSPSPTIVITLSADGSWRGGNRKFTDSSQLSPGGNVRMRICRISFSRQRTSGSTRLRTSWTFTRARLPGQIGCTKFSALQRRCKINEVSGGALAPQLSAFAPQLSASSGRHQILQQRRDIPADTATLRMKCFIYELMGAAATLRGCRLPWNV